MTYVLYEVPQGLPPRVRLWFGRNLVRSAEIWQDLPRYGKISRYIGFAEILRDQIEVSQNLCIQTVARRRETSRKTSRTRSRGMPEMFRIACLVLRSSVPPRPSITPALQLSTYPLPCFLGLVQSPRVGRVALGLGLGLGFGLS